MSAATTLCFAVKARIDDTSQRRGTGSASRHGFVTPPDADGSAGDTVTPLSLTELCLENRSKAAISLSRDLSTDPGRA